MSALPIKKKVKKNCMYQRGRERLFYQPSRHSPYCSNSSHADFYTEGNILKEYREWIAHPGYFA